MGVKNYLIEGVSCAGKTTVCNELQKRGYHAIHGDRQLAYQGDPQTGVPTEGVTHEHHIWDMEKVKEIAADKTHPVTFFCGGSRNFSKFIDVFDGVFVLEIDSETLEKRLNERPKDEWGGKPEERALIERLHQTKEDIPRTGIVIDAARPVEQVADEILDWVEIVEAECYQQISQVIGTANELLDHRILGIYLYGSATLGGLRPDSDIDILILTNAEMPADVRKKLTKRLMDISGWWRIDEKRPLEVTVVNQKDMVPWQFPPKCEYMYGEWLRLEMEAGKIPQACYDTDLAILLWQARKYSKVLKGKAAETWIPDIPFEEIRKAIRSSLPGLLGNLKGDERNVLLTLARMWFTLETGEISAKDRAAEWACSKLPKDLSPLLEIAKEAYLGKLDDHWENTEKETMLLADYMKEKIE